MKEAETCVCVCVCVLLGVLPAVCVGAVLLVLQGVQVGLSTVTVMQQGGAQLQNGCVPLVGVCVSDRVRVVRWKQVRGVTVFVTSPLAVSLVGGG